MTTPTLLDACARIIRDSAFPHVHADDIARALIQIIRPAVLEEAALVCEAERVANPQQEDQRVFNDGANCCAFSIRALATPTDTEKDTP